MSQPSTAFNHLPAAIGAAAERGQQLVRLDKAPAPHRPLSHADAFFQSLRGSQAALDLVNQVGTLAAQLHVEVHHTLAEGGDLRVCADRATGHPLQRNVLTMVWRSTKGHFSCGGYVTPEDCAALALPPAGIRYDPQRRWSSFRVRPGADNAALCSIVALAVRRFRAG